MRYRDKLQEGLQDRVEKFLSGYEDELPDALVGLDKEQLVKNVTNIAIGRLNLILDIVIESAIYNFERMVYYSKKNNP